MYYNPCFTYKNSTANSSYWGRTFTDHPPHPASKPPFVFLREKEREGFARSSLWEPPQPELLQKSILFSIIKLVFRVREFIYWSTDGPNWARCTKRTAFRPGFKTVSQQHAAYNSELTQQDGRGKTIILFEQRFRQTSRSFRQIFFVEGKKTSMLSEFPTKHASNSPVTFVTIKRFAVLFFLPSCCVNSLLGSLSNDVFERRTSTGSCPFSFLGDGFAQIFSQIVSIRVKKLSNTNYIASRHITREKSSLPVNVRCSKTSLLKLPIIFLEYANNEL